MRSEFIKYIYQELYFPEISKVKFEENKHSDSELIFGDEVLAFSSYTNISDYLSHISYLYESMIEDIETNIRFAKSKARISFYLKHLKTTLIKFNKVGKSGLTFEYFRSIFVV